MPQPLLKRLPFDRPSHPNPIAWVYKEYPAEVMCPGIFPELSSLMIHQSLVALERYGDDWSSGLGPNNPNAESRLKLIDAAINSGVAYHVIDWDDAQNIKNIEVILHQVSQLRHASIMDWAQAFAMLPNHPPLAALLGARLVVVRNMIRHEDRHHRRLHQKWVDKAEQVWGVKSDFGAANSSYEAFHESAIGSFRHRELLLEIHLSEEILIVTPKPKFNGTETPNILVVP